MISTLFALFVRNARNSFSMVYNKICIISIMRIEIIHAFLIPLDFFLYYYFVIKYYCKYYAYELLLHGIAVRSYITVPILLTRQYYESRFSTTFLFFTYFIICYCWREDYLDYQDKLQTWFQYTINNTIHPRCIWI